MATMTRRGVIWGLAYISGIFGIFRLLDKSPDAGGIPQPFRKALGFNENFWERLYSPYRRVPEYSKSRVTPERLNETIGMEDDLDPDSWRLLVEGVHGSTKPVIELAMKDIFAMPASEMTTEFFCIEGWSAIWQWRGVPFRTFLERIGADLSARYVGFKCADRYYSSLDMATALHPQTQLTLDFRDAPLPAKYGYPLKLRVPTKLGFKNPKHIAAIFVTNTNPGGYWEDQGYNWFSGL